MRDAGGLHLTAHRPQIRTNGEGLIWAPPKSILTPRRYNTSVPPALPILLSLVLLLARAPAADTFHEVTFDTEDGGRINPTSRETTHRASS